MKPPLGLPHPPTFQTRRILDRTAHPVPSASATTARPAGVDSRAGTPFTASACAGSARSAGQPPDAPPVAGTSPMATGIGSTVGRRPTMWPYRPFC
eukprot:14125694-Alexandrium_andersonii.AAC.1